MKQLKVRWNFIIIFYFVMMVLVPTSHGETLAAMYYVSPSGTGSTCSSSSPCALSYGVNTKAIAGDTVYLQNGTYTTGLSVTKSGTIGNPVTIQALNDGQAYIVTEYPNSPLSISQQNWINVKGINFKNTSSYYCSEVYQVNCTTQQTQKAHGINIGGSSNINLSRLFVDGSSGFNSNVILVTGSTNVLLEDIAVTGPGRTIINTFANMSGSSIVSRRVWAKWTGPSTGGGDTNSINQTYDTQSVLVENCIGGSTTIADGWGAWSNYGTASNNRFYGNIIFNNNPSAGSFYDARQDDTKTANNNIFINNVAINTTSGARLVGATNHLSRNNTYIGVNTTGSYEGFFGRLRPNTTSASGIIQNNSFLTWKNGLYYNAEGISITENYNNFYNVVNPVYKNGVTTLGTGDKQINPNYPYSTYGAGAYLMVPTALKGQGESGADIGAEVLYRYDNGTLTDTPLWPWPMEDRICAETGYSVTYENGYSGCTMGGGLWKTLDGVYSGVQTYQCSDGLDNDGDSLIDYPNDPGCSSSTDNDESITVSSNSVTSLKTNNPITIDGNLSENSWNQANYITFTNPSRSDNQVKVYTLWDDNNLYFAYDISDSNLEAVNQALYQDDGIEIYLDTNNNKTTSMDSNDYHFTVNINNLISGGNIITQRSSKANGYTMEIAVPWSVINKIPSSGMTMGLLLGNNDRDNSLTSQFDWLNLIETGFYSGPNLWGDIVISSTQIGSADTTPPAPPAALMIQ